MLSLVVLLVVAVVTGTAVADDDGFKKKSKSKVTAASVKLSLIDADGELTLGGEFQRKPPAFPAF